MRSRERNDAKGSGVSRVAVVLGLFLAGYCLELFVLVGIISFHTRRVDFDWPLGTAWYRHDDSVCGNVQPTADGRWRAYHEGGLEIDRYFTTREAAYRNVEFWCR